MESVLHSINRGKMASREDYAQVKGHRLHPKVKRCPYLRWRRGWPAHEPPATTTCEPGGELRESKPLFVQRGSKYANLYPGALPAETRALQIKLLLLPPRAPAENIIACRSKL